MALDPDAAIEALALVVDAVRDSAKLQMWFHQLASLSEDGRRQAIDRATREMNAERASDVLVAAFGLLSHPDLFAAVLSALRECGVRV
jgi:hypothetical protein